MLASPLMDRTRYVRDFEAALRGMWRAAIDDGRSRARPEGGVPD
jgi:hypothetical protein